MSFEQILYDVNGRIATLTLNRPEKLNAWTTKMEAEVRAAMEQASGDDEVRVIVLTGAGRGFCSGADMEDLSGAANPAGGEATSSVARRRHRENTPARRDGIPEDFQKRYSYFPSIGKPVIAAVNGPAVGLGLIMALYCDLRIASEAARFGTAFSRRGLIAEHGISWLLPRLVGPANALDLLFSARVIDSSEALRMGLVNRVLPNEKLLEGVRAYATEIATMVSPRSLRLIKKQVYQAQFQTLAQAIESADEDMFQSFDTADFKEGVAHFVEKRMPAFK